MKPARLRPTVRPTVAGISWLLAILALLATAINYGNNLVFALAFVQFAIVLQAAWACRRNLSGIEWRTRVDDSVPAELPFVLASELVDRAERGHERVFLHRAARGQDRSGIAVDISARSDCAVAIEIPGLPRGRHAVGDFALASTHPLGLWRARLRLPAQEVLVHPRPRGERHLPTALPRPAHRRQETGDFQGLRAYAPGDATRRINWRVYSRRGELAVSQYDGGAGGDVLWLSLDQAPGDLEQRLSQLAGWVLEAERRGLEYGMRLGESNAPAARGREQRRACLRLLALHAVQA